MFHHRFFRRASVPAVAALTALASATGAHATLVVVGFDDGPTAAAPSTVDLPYYAVDSPYTEAGVTITTAAPNETFRVLKTNSPFTTGSPYLLPNPNDTRFTITTESGDPFSLISLDVIEIIGDGPLVFSFAGTSSGGTTITENLTTDGAADYASVDGTPDKLSFSDLASGVFESVSFVIPGAMTGIDNLTIAIAAVPEPSLAGAMGLLTSAGVLAVGRRRR